MEKLDKLQGIIPPNQQQISPAEHIKMFTKIVWSCFKQPYERNHLIVAPALTTLNDNTKKWLSTKHKAPYTSIIGPTMSGKI
jgi:hypothetical protein